MKRTKFFLVLMACLLLMALALVSCDTVAGSGGGNPFMGTWLGYDWGGDRIRVEVDNSTWIMTWPGYPQWGYVSGSYTVSGNTVTLKDPHGYALGTGTVSGNSATINITGQGTCVVTKE